MSFAGALNAELLASVLIYKILLPVILYYTNTVHVLIKSYISVHTYVRLLHVDGVNLVILFVYDSA